MSSTCQAFNAIQKIRAASHVNIAYIGGSLTAAAGTGDTAVTCWRRLFTRYIYERFHPVYHCQPMEVMGGIGAMESYGAVFTLERNVLPNNPDLAFVEFCYNDKGSGDKELVRKGIEGIIRQLKACPTRPDVVLLGAGKRPEPDAPDHGAVDHSLHREIAAHYGCGFIDIQDFLWRTLEERNLTWDHISIVFEENDPCHLNDYGNWMWFEAMRQWFEAQWQLYEQQPTLPGPTEMPAPFASDEFQFTNLVDPSRRNKAIERQGSWEKRDEHTVPWYLDNVLVGRPGDTLRYTFTGTGIGAICMVHCNGLKLQATIDGDDVPGPFTHFGIEFGKFFIMAHGLDYGEHVLELTVDKPSRRRNKLADPTAQIGYLCVARGREA